MDIEINNDNNNTLTSSNAAAPGEDLLEKAKQIMKSLFLAQGLEYTATGVSADSQQAAGCCCSSELNGTLSCQDQQHFVQENNENNGTNEELSEKCTDLATSSDPQHQELQRQCDHVNLFWQLPNLDEQFYIFGGIYVDFTHLNQDTSMKLMKRAISSMEYFQKDGLIVLRYGDNPPTIRELDFLINRAESLNDEKYHILAEQLRMYNKQIPEFLAVSQSKASQLSQEYLFDTYDEHYKQFEKWALEEVRKMDTTQLFAFTIHKFNFRTLEFETKIAGQSKALLALRGIDLDNPFQFTQRQAYHYLDGESNINLVINQLSRISKGKEIMPSLTRMKTFDNLRVLIEHTCMHCTNRDKIYPYWQDQLPESQFKYEFMIGLAFYEVPPDAVEQIVKIRQNRSAFDNCAFEDFSYSMESQIFLERFYKEKLEKIEKLPYKKCGFISDEPKNPC